MTGATLTDRRAQLGPGSLATRLERLVAELFPLFRSITGDGVRETLRLVAEHCPLEVREVPSGTAVLDWHVPPEWNAREAWIAGPDGARVLDARASNLHLVGYSEPFQGRMSLAELRTHLHTRPDRPDLVPYRTAYWARTWGFCCTQELADSLPEGEYEVCVDTTLDETGSLTYGELLVPGATEREVLLSTHVCHPSLANDNCTGIAITALLGGLLAECELRYSYRLLFVPGTIGSITWLARNDDAVPRIDHGLVLTGLGDEGPLTYKRSRRGDAAIDRAAAHVLATASTPGAVIDFSPYGYDERQYCSPGFDLPVGRLSRTPHGEYPEYHSSGDDLSFVSGARMAEAFGTVAEILDVVERDAGYRNLVPRGEPQLGRRGLYRAIGGDVDSRSTEMALLWVLNLSDGGHSLLDIACRSGLPFDAVHAAAAALHAHDLLAVVE